MKSLLILPLLCSLAANMLAQSINGNWYTPLRNKLLCISISEDSIFLRKCQFDAPEIFTADEGTFYIEKSAGNSFVASAVWDGTRLYCVFAFQPVTGNSKLLLNAESWNNMYTSVTDAEKAIPSIESCKLMITLISLRHMENLKLGLDIAEMRVPDFKEYARLIIESDSVNAPHFAKRRLSYLYAESTGRLFLADVGFNPFVGGRAFDEMIMKFGQLEETKADFERMSAKRK